MISPAFPSYLDPADRVLDQLSRYDFKKSPVLFNSLYQALENHTQRELDSSVAFETSLFPANLTVATSEHPFCFAFALGVKLIRLSDFSTPILVSAYSLGKHVCLVLSADTNGEKVEQFFKEQASLFEHLAEIAKFETLLELGKKNVTLTFTIPIYDASTFQVYTLPQRDLSEVFALAISYVKEQYTQK